MVLHGCALHGAMCNYLAVLCQIPVLVVPEAQGLEEHRQRELVPEETHGFFGVLLVPLWQITRATNKHCRKLSATQQRRKTTDSSAAFASGSAARWGANAAGS